jgi:hypothetical protein
LIERVNLRILSTPPGWSGFSRKKPFYHGFRPLPLENPGK